MSTNKVWTVISGIEYHLNILKDKLINIDEETKQSVDEAYQRGVKDGKEQNEKGCDGCMWEYKDYNTCSICCNSYKNMYEAKKADDEIKVRDEVMAYGCRGVVTYVHENLYTVMMHDGSCGNWGRNELKKTGKQHDIDKILEEMKE